MATRTVLIEGAAKRRIDLLKVGDRVDLEADAIADPEYHASGDPMASSHPEWQFEFERVLEIERETADCIRVDFESGFSCGFPPDHLIDVDGEQDENH